MYPSASQRPGEVYVAMLRLAQRGFVVLGVTYFVLLSGQAVTRSLSRTSVLSHSWGAIDPRGENEAQKLAETTSRLHLQDFHRVQVKDGRPVWEVQAKEARYFADQSLTHVNDATFTIHRKDEGPVVITSAVAKLFFLGSDIVQAELEGKVRMSVEGSFTMETDYVRYSVAKEEFLSPRDVHIEGTGYQVDGQEMRFVLPTKALQLKKNVSSRFDMGAKMPKELGLQNAKKK